uniref:Anticodon_2 domain-containing protein n=1 Tax=Gongylonema pulchrum TaxID=637853 RepID=A0A183D7B2_9BILA
LDQLVLDAYGHKAIQSADVDNELVPEVMRRLQRFLPEGAAELLADPSYVKKVLDLFDRTDRKLSYLEQLTECDFKYYFLRPSSPAKLLAHFEADVVSNVLRSVIDCTEWSLDSLRNLAAGHGMKYAAVLQIIRLALIDSRNGPPVMELFQFFGKDECLKRFSELLVKLEQCEVSAAA